jgi:hypothetical protein
MTDQNKKTAYQTPRLFEFGSVRNLTGGSTGQVSDGVAEMSIPMGGGGGGDPVL